MKSLFVFFVLLVGNEAMAQGVWGWPNYTPVAVPVVQPVVVQEVKMVPVVENKVVYQPGMMVVYQPVVPTQPVVVQPVLVYPPHRCRLFGGW
jgi:hypothetical protein